MSKLKTVSVTVPMLRVASSAVLTVAIGLCLSLTAHAQKVPTYSVDVNASRTWTNDDIPQLQREAPVSFFTPGATPGAQTPEATPAAVVAVAVRPTRAQDPDWYADQAAQLQAELDNRQIALADYVRAVEDARSRAQMSSGIALDKANVGVTVEAGIEILQTRVDEVENQIANLADLARLNGIEPGVLRG